MRTWGELPIFGVTCRAASPRGACDAPAVIEGAALYSPARHTPLAGDDWTEARARLLVQAIVADLESGWGGEDALWPNHPADLEDDPDSPWRTLYFGASGVLWALARLTRDDLAAPRLDLPGIASRLYERWLLEPEWVDLYPPPQPSLLMGAAGLLLLADELAPGDPDRRDALAQVIAANERNPTRELLWGSPGTMLAALAMTERDDDPRWTALWRASAEWLVGERDADGLWDQDMYGTHARYLGPAHGFAGNVHALLRGRALLDPAVADDVERSAVAVLAGFAQSEGRFVQWPAVVDGHPEPDGVRTQWCHGAPGMVTALGGVLPHAESIDALLIGGGELTWAAGPLRASASLCHGTAGNGYAFLRLFERTGDELWLSRARAFAMHAAAQAREARQATGPRPPLFSGEAGVAIFLAACLTGDARFPLLDDA